jgi:hypothetical protein
MEQHLTIMFQREFRTFRYLVVFAQASHWMIYIFRPSQYWAELLFSVSFMFFLLAGIHGLSILVQIIYCQPLTNDNLYKALATLDDIEADFDE